MIKSFRMRASVCEMQSFKEFAEEFSVGKGDLIITERFLYEDYIKPLSLDCDYLFYGDYRVGEPDEDFFDTAIALCAEMPHITRVIGVGGGSIMDTAKLLSLKDIKSPLDVFGGKGPYARGKKCICVPTTCGTGSEMDGIIAGEMKVMGKVGKGIDEATPDQAVLISELIDKLPYRTFMFCSADALVHCMETSVSPNAHPFSTVYGYEGIRIIVDRYIRIRENGPEERYQYLADFLRASAYGGICLSYAPCGASHAMAHHFGSNYHVSHGESNAMFVAPTFQFYARQNPEGSIKDMAQIIAKAAGVKMDTIEAFQYLSELLNDIVPMKRLKEYGISEPAFPGFAERVLETQQRLLVQSYITPIRKEHLIGIYRDMY